MNVYFSVIKLELVPLLICLIQDSEHETWTVFYNFLKKANRSVKLTLFIPHFKTHSHSDLKYNGALCFTIDWDVTIQTTTLRNQISLINCIPLREDGAEIPRRNIRQSNLWGWAGLLLTLDLGTI